MPELKPLFLQMAVILATVPLMAVNTRGLVELVILNVGP